MARANYQECEKLLATKLVNLRDRDLRTILKDKRERRIREALKWTKGTLDTPAKHLVSVIPDNVEVYFLKPGKEAEPNEEGEIKNPNDMTPMVGEVYEKTQFKNLWVYLSRISALNFDAFKAVMTLVYRSAYMIDHKKDENMNIRYCPNTNIENLIFDIQEDIGGILPRGGLLGLLHFFDILGWNEDVKYHSDRNQLEPTFTGKYKFKTGRINTLLTMIKVPFEMHNFLNWVIDNVRCMKDVNFENAYNVTQHLTMARGVSPASQSEVLEWLSPYIHQKEPIH